MKFARKLKNVRLDRKLRQHAVARAAGVNAAAYSKIESGVNRPRGETLVGIAHELSVPVDYLLDDEAPYPFVPPPEREIKKPKKKVRKLITQEEWGLLKDLRKAAPLARKVALAIPCLRPEFVWAAWQVLAREWRGQG